MNLNSVGELGLASFMLTSPFNSFLGRRLDAPGRAGRVAVVHGRLQFQGRASGGDAGHGHRPVATTGFWLEETVERPVALAGLASRLTRSSRNERRPQSRFDLQRSSDGNQVQRPSPLPRTTRSTSQRRHTRLLRGAALSRCGAGKRPASIRFVIERALTPISFAISRADINAGAEAVVPIFPIHFFWTLDTEKNPTGNPGGFNTFLSHVSKRSTCERFARNQLSPQNAHGDGLSHGRYKRLVAAAFLACSCGGEPVPLPRVVSRSKKARKPAGFPDETHSLPGGGIGRAASEDSRRKESIMQYREIYLLVEQRS